MSAEIHNRLAEPTPGSAKPDPVLVADNISRAFGGVHAVDVAHLEIQRFRPIQEAQMGELMGRLEGVAEPVFLVGDLNSDADGSQTASYGMALAAGFLDTWERQSKPGAGYTCCYHKDLMGGLDKMDQRIDFVLYRDPDDPSADKISGKVWQEILGDGQDDLTTSGLWPSDHRGLSVDLRVPQRKVQPKP